MATSHYQWHVSVHHSLQRITDILQQVPAIGYLYRRIFFEPCRQCALLPTWQQYQGTMSIEVNDQSAVPVAPVPCPFIDTAPSGRIVVA